MYALDSPTVIRGAFASLAFYVLIGVSSTATAADKIKIQVVETTMTIGLVPYTSPGTPEEVQTDCNTIAGIHCNSTVTPATEASTHTSPQVILSG